MTAIAAILRKAAHVNLDQVLIGDLMVSAPMAQRGASEVILPTGYRPVSILRDDGHPVRLMQKLVIICPVMTLAWAGRVIFAQWACKLLRKRFGGRSAISIDDAEEILKVLMKECTNEDAFILSVLDKEGGYLWTKHSNAWKDYECQGDVHMFTAGTGSHHLSATLERLSDIESPTSLGYGLVLISMMIEQELVSATSTAEAYGGAWEIVFIDNWQFRKLDTVIYSHFSIDLGDSDYGISQNSVIGLKYFGERLSIRALISRDNDRRTELYANAFPPDIKSLAKKPAKFVLDMPNHVTAISVLKDTRPPDVSWKIMLGLDHDDQPFWETSRDAGGVHMQINGRIFDEVVLPYSPKTPKPSKPA